MSPKLIYIFHSIGFCIQSGGAWCMLHSFEIGQLVEFGRQENVTFPLDMMLFIKPALLVLPLLSVLGMRFIKPNEPNSFQRAVTLGVMWSSVGTLILVFTVFAILDQVRMLPPLGMH
jgi:hypothetical protein